MSESENALVPLEERAVDFYGDQLVAILVDIAGEPQVYVPVKPVCDLLGLDWPSQYQRIRRDVVLSGATQGIVVTTNPSGQAESARVRRGGGPQIMICLPADYLHGWLFGVNASRVKPELRDKLIQYQRECYRVLARAFQGEYARREQPPAPPVAFTPGLVWSLAQLLTDIARWQLELEQRIRKLERRDKPEP